MLEGGSDYLAKVLTGKNKEERADFIEKRSQYINNIEQVFNTYKKEITGAAAGEKEIDQLRASFLNGDMSPSEFMGAMDQVVSKYKSESDINKSTLNNGVNTTMDDGLRQHFKQNGKTDAEIDQWFKNRGK